MIVPWNTLDEHPGDDPRLRRFGDVRQLAGPGPAGEPQAGPLGRGMWRIGAGGTGHAELHVPVPVRRFAVYVRGRGKPELTLDGRAASMRAADLVQAADIVRWTTNPVECGATVLRIGSRAGPLDLWAVEALPREGAAVRVSTFARSGVSTDALVIDSPDAGMPYHFDAVGADLAVMLLGANDRSAGSKSFSNRVRYAVDRVRRAGGEALLVAPFEVDNDDPRVGLMPARARSLDLERISETEAVELLELGGAWSSYRDALRRGWFADGIHPSDAGLEMIAGRIATAILARFDVPCA